MFMNGSLMKKNRRYNSEIAKKYLNENVLSYDEWFLKFKNS